MNTYNFIGIDKNNREFQVEVNANNEQEAWETINNYFSLELNIQMV